MSSSSHIVLPKVVLRKFEPMKGVPFYWIDYSSAPRYFIRQGLAASFNTQKDYYEPEVEEFLSKTVENHINSLLKLAPDTSNEDLILDEKFQNEAYLYFEALLSRDPTFHMEREESPSKIVMAATRILKTEGIVRNSFNVSYIINKSKVPYTLPSNGIIQINNKAFICPLSPQVALYYFNSTDNHYKEVNEDDFVMEINRKAFKQALVHNCSALICSEQSVLDTLKKEHLSNKQ